VTLVFVSEVSLLIFFLKKSVVIELDLTGAPSTVYAGEKVGINAKTTFCRLFVFVYSGGCG
jgi:hypothetical protein